MVGEANNLEYNVMELGDISCGSFKAVLCEVKPDYPGMLEGSKTQVAQDNGEVNSPKGRRWKWLAREGAFSSNDNSMVDQLGKRVLVYEDLQEQREQSQIRCV
ncbi:hypothetical protein ACOSQ2_028641 [Xanthoceras sorbifolium]